MSRVTPFAMAKVVSGMLKTESVMSGYLLDHCAFGLERVF